MKRTLLALALLFSGVACAGPNDFNSQNSGSGIVQISEANYDSLITSKTPVVVDVYADWCQPCKNFGKTFDKVQPDFAGKVQFAKLNIDTIGKKGDPLKIDSIPVVLFIKNGKIVGRHAGAMSEETFRKELNKYFGS
jgi:thioredoxin